VLVDALLFLTATAADEESLFPAHFQCYLTWVSQKHLDDGPTLAVQQHMQENVKQHRHTSPGSRKREEHSGASTEGEET